MQTLTENTEEKILSAAEKIFMRDGYAGSRMQDIADMAGINKAMLHYYFRSKDKLFEQIFLKNAGELFPQIEDLLKTEQNFIQILHIFIEKYVRMLKANPFLPLFIMSTVNNPNQSDFIEKLPHHIFRKFVEKYHNDKAKGLVNEVDAFQFVISVMAMCVFPFMAKPIIMQAGSLNSESFDKLMENRILEIKKYTHTIIVKV